MIQQWHQNQSQRRNVQEMDAAVEKKMDAKPAFVDVQSMHVNVVNLVLALLIKNVTIFWAIQLSNRAISQRIRVAQVTTMITKRKILMIVFHALHLKRNGKHSFIHLIEITTLLVENSIHC